MQTNTTSTVVERADKSATPSKHPDPVGAIGAFIFLVLFVLWLSADFARERAWFAERKKRLDAFRIEAERRHAEVREAQMREALFNAGMTQRPRPVAKKLAPKTPVDATPKQRKIFKLYG
jgi:hypothetical protein